MNLIEPALPSTVAALRPLVSGANWGQLAREYLQQAKAELLERHRKGSSGHSIVQSYTAVMDHLLETLFEAASAAYAERYSRLNQRCVVMAQGGYGRAELNPCSDIDLLFLYEHKRDPYIENVGE